MKSFGERLQEIRREYGLNQVELAKRLGMSKVSISKFESGVMQPSLDTMLKIKKRIREKLGLADGF